MTIKDISWDDRSVLIEIDGKDPEGKDRYATRFSLSREEGRDLALRLAAIYHDEIVIDAAQAGRYEVVIAVMQSLKPFHKEPK